MEAFGHAIALTSEPVLQRHLAKRLNALSGPVH
jgi:hypothetical protein